MRCNVRAHPWVWRVLWYKDGTEITPTDKIFVDEQTLR